MLRAVAATVRERGGSVQTAFTPVARDRPWLAELEADDVPVAFCPPGPKRNRARFVQDLIGESSEPAVVHTHFTSFDLPATSAVRGRPATAVFWHVHSRLRRERGVRARNAVKFAFAGRRVDGILCVAPDIAAAVQARHAPRDRVVLLPNAIDLSRFPPQARARAAEARRRLRIGTQARVLMHFGWDWGRKGGDLFLEAVRPLVEREGVVAVTVGGGQAARASRKRLGLPEDLVRVIDPTEDVSMLYAAADVFVSTSEAEGMPYSVAEALASGLAVVATDIPGHAFIAHEAGNVRLTLHEPDEVAAAVRSALATDPAIAAAAAARARSRVASRLDLEAWAQRVVDMYEDALSTGA
jgi:glycosyltransferase involved in cell wall biosynthesis